MSSPSKTSKTFFAWIWSHISAGVALALIVVALMIGYRLGHSSSTSMTDMTDMSSSNMEMDEHSDHDESEHTHSSATQMYTCSMHPSVRLTDPDAKCPLCHMDLIPVTDSLDEGGDQNQLVLSESAKAMSQIETTPVGQFFPTANIRLFGKMTYDETSVARISAYFSGRIDRLFVNYVGVSVQEGDHLAEIYSPDLLAAIAEFEQAQASAKESANGSEFLKTTAEQTLEAAREKLRLFGISQDQIDVIEAGEFVDNELTIYSPIGGVVTTLSAREGDYLKTGDAIATVADLSRLWLDLEAYESQLPMLRWGVRVQFTVEAHPGEVFEGRISFIEPIVNDKTRTAAVRVSVENTDLRLKPGMFVTAVAKPKLSTNGAIVNDDMAGKWVCPMHPTEVKDEPGDCDICGMEMVPAESLGVVDDPSSIVMPMVVPRTAVLFTGTRSVVYVQVPDTDNPTYEARTVELGPRAGEYYIVRSGLDLGDQVVTHGAFRIDSAMQIAAKPSMMAPNGGGAPSMPGMDMGTDMPGMDMSSMPTVPDSFIQSLDPVYNAYLDAQERLADDDLGGFLESSKQLNDAVDGVELVGLTGDNLAAWRKAMAGLKITSPITTIDNARDLFENMSLLVIDLQDRFGHTQSETWHVAYCPMKKAKWVQRGTDIINPFYGSSMLSCGDITKDYAPIDGNQSEKMSDEDMKAMPGMGGGQDD